MARAAVRWTVADVAARARVSANTVTGFETERTSPHPVTLDALKRVYEAAGCSFIESGVVYRDPQTSLAL
jgi:transcriptional regulator with XRE-family HTH domain